MIKVAQDINAISTLIKSVVTNADMIEHSGKTVLDHLIGTYIILEELEAPEAVKLAGAFHNIYDTEKFKLGMRDLIERDWFIKKIGIEAEEIVFLFSNLNWAIFTKTPPVNYQKNYFSYFIQCDVVEPFHFELIVLLFFANIMEQIDIIPYEKRIFFCELARKYKNLINEKQLLKIEKSLLNK